MSELILCRTGDGQTLIDLRAIDSTACLTQLEIAELFATSKQNVNLHIANLLKEGELGAVSVVKESLTTAANPEDIKTLGAVDKLLEKSDKAKTV